MTSELLDANGTIPVFAGTHVPQLRLPSSVRLEVMQTNGHQAPAATFVETEIISNEEIAPEHYLMRVRSEALANGEPGQFGVIRPGSATDVHPILPRPMAVYQYDKAAGTADFVYRVVGYGTAAMAQRRAGDIVEIVGPVGRPFPISDTTNGILIVGRGIGVCSLTTLIDEANRRNIEIYAVFSARNKDVVLGRDMIKKARGHALYVDDSDGSSDVSNVEPWISEIIESGRAQQAYVCGSNRLIELTTRLAAPADVETYVSLEAHMACGLGYCHSCATGAFGESAESPLVCRDGPVFRCHPAGVTV